MTPEDLAALRAEVGELRDEVAALAILQRCGYELLRDCLSNLSAAAEPQLRPAAIAQGLDAALAARLQATLEGFEDVSPSIAARLAEILDQLDPEQGST